MARKTWKIFKSEHGDIQGIKIEIGGLSGGGICRSGFGDPCAKATAKLIPGLLMYSSGVFSGRNAL